TLAANIDTDKKENTLSLELPYLLSFFAYDEFSGSLEDLNQIQERYEKEYGPGNYIPPVKKLFWSFRVMVGAGSVMIILGLYGVYKIIKDSILEINLYTYDECSGSIEGLNQIQERYEKEYGPGNYIPPVKTLFWSFRAMVGAGSVMILLGLYGVYKIRKDRILENTLYLKIMVWAIF